MSNQERPKPRRRPYVKVCSSPSESLASAAKRMVSSNEFAGVGLMAEWILCLAFITFY